MLGDYPRLGVSEAKQKATQIVEQLKHGIDPAGKLGLLKTEGSFEGVARKFLYRGNFAPKTLDEYSRIINKELIPVFSSKLISQITEREVKAILFEISEQKPTLANRVRAVLQGIFNLAVDAGLCDKNVVLQIRPHVKETRNRKPRGENRASLEVLKTLYTNAQNLSPASRALIRFTLLSGVSARLVEQLTWNELRGDFWITGGGETVFLTASHREQINALLKNEQYIFSPDDGKTPFKNSRVTLQRISKGLNEKYSWSDISASVRFQMLKLGFNYSDLAVVFAIGQKQGLEKPDTSLIQRSAKRVFNDWALIITDQPLEDDSATNVIRMRRLKRLK